MTRLIRLMHAWSGAMLGVALFAICLSGAILLAEPIVRSTLLERVPDRLTPAQIGREAEAIIQSFEGEAIAAMKTPQPGFGYWRVLLDDGGGAIVQSGSLQRVDSWSHPAGDFFAGTYELHAHLFAGEPGETVVGILGGVLVLFAFTGLYLWWNARGPRAYRPAPASMRRPDLLRWHRDIGALFAALIILSGATGLGMVFETPLRTWLERSPEAPPRVERAPPGWSGATEALAAAYPGASVQLLLLPLNAEDPVGFRLRQAHEWHPNGRTDVWIDLQDGEVVGGSDDRGAGAATRALASLFPLHAGVHGSPWWSVILALCGVIMSALIAIGSWTFISVRMFKKGRQRGD